MGGADAPDAVVVDGYNVLHAIPRFAPRGGPLAPARERLASWLAAAARRRGVSECVLVWDGRDRGTVERGRPPLTVVHTAAGVTADDRILDLCRGRFAARVGSTWVVSSDHGVQVPARELGFRVLGAMTFYRRWRDAGGGSGSAGSGLVGSGGAEGDPGAETRPRVARAEVEDLLEEFLDATPEGPERESPRPSRGGPGARGPGRRSPPPSA